ncbi:Gfo/Idh/MocA family oxidoreductase [uncultured Roseobacter sp.]|uniref:Gfo/Idh/MocA family protein n=1 Tax=uncultured Roseobacter sp. TaxID=114847 RepID=UPI00262524F3|nr:Gfo/Idh/MocA family oxidoreductase [uncultured Roseobacter sp.]
MSRILVVGGGLIGIRHLQAVAAHPACTLVGLVDPNPEIITDYPRFADMAEVPAPVDGVILATPTHLHSKHGAYAAKRGWPMLIEKPVTEDLAQARVLQKAIQTAKVPSLVGHHRRYHAPVQQMKSLVANGAIGQPVTATLIWAMRKPDAYFDGNWRSAHGSPVLINLVHDIDLLRFVLGDIAAVSALRGRRLRGQARVESGAVALAFESGATGTIAFADTAPSPWGFEAGTGENPNIGTTRQDMLWITGTKGAISFPSMTLWSGQDWSRPAEQVPCTRAENAKPPLDAQLDHFLEVTQGAAPLIDVADATRTLDIALQIEDQLRQQAPAPEPAHP